jgi:cell division septal protein FtsQ
MFKKKTPTESDSNRQPQRNLPTRQNIYTYYKSRSFREEKPVRQTFDTLNVQRDNQPRQQYLLQRKFKVSLIVILLLGLLIYDLILSSVVTISTINLTKISDIYMHPTVMYQQATEKLLRKSIANRTKITINTTKIDDELLQEFPELASVSVQVPIFGSRLKVVISPVYPAIIVNDQTNQHFLIGPNGVTLRPVAANFIPNLSLPVVTDQTALLAQVGKQVLAPSDINFIITISAQLMAHKIGIQSMILPVASRELDVYINGQPYFVKFNLADSSSMDVQIGTYFATLNYLTSNHVTPTQYIDTRIAGRVFYK